MKRLGMVCAALLLVSACGGESGSDGDVPEAAATSPTLALLTAGQACAQVQMVNDALHGPGRWPKPTYGEFGEKTSGLADQSVPEIAGSLRAMSQQAIKVGEATDDDEMFDAAGEWATQYQKVADICARTDSPIGQLP